MNNFKNNPPAYYRIEIPVSNGMKIVAEQNQDPAYDRELYIGIVDRDGAWIQDLVCVQNEYRYKPDGQMDWVDGSFRVMVWSDPRQDDLTDEFVVPLRDDESWWGWLTPYLDTVLEDDDADHGGTAFHGETLGDFLLGSDLSDLDVKSMDDVNRILRENGIKPIDHTGKE